MAWDACHMMNKGCYRRKLLATDTIAKEMMGSTT